MIDPQDPLPEGTWLWRRLFIWGLIAACCWGVWTIIPRIHRQAELVEVIKWLIGLVALLATYYLIAPSAEHITRLVQAGAALRARAVARAAEAIAPTARRQSEGDAP